MRPLRLRHIAVIAPLIPFAAALLTPRAGRTQSGGPPDTIDFTNGDGISQTLTTHPTFDTTNPFFKPLGTNGRTCATCHPPSQGMTISPQYAQHVFAQSAGLDPLFAPIDGANSPQANMSTVAARTASCSMLLTRGLIRIGRPMPANAEFTLAAVVDPYHYASSAELSLFRRPLPTTNLKFLANVMWDGRELAPGDTILQALESQAKDAVLGHEQGSAAPAAAIVSQILNFETSLFTTQIYDDSAGALAGSPIDAGPASLVSAPYFPGINQPFGNPNGGPPFNPNVFTQYNPWYYGPGTPPPPPHPTAQQLAQMSVARGEHLFNTRPFLITGVAGLNDVLGKPAVMGTCSTCHNSPEAGSSSVPMLLNTGIADGARRTPDMPLYTLRNKKSGTTLQTTDPGAALTTGRWADIGKFKVPALRGLEDQSPYMHNGFSGDLLDVLDFYNTRFNIQLTPQEKADLKAFLVTL